MDAIPYLLDGNKRPYKNMRSLESLPVCLDEQFQGTGANRSRWNIALSK
ncbi:hypothetical protein [Mesobacillus foraminis]|nr:hypothetical protein [Mesobacillus foraminis]